MTAFANAPAFDDNTWSHNVRRNGPLVREIGDAVERPEGAGLRMRAGTGERNCKIATPFQPKSGHLVHLQSDFTGGN